MCILKLHSFKTYQESGEESGPTILQQPLIY